MTLSIVLCDGSSSYRGDLAGFLARDEGLAVTGAFERADALPHRLEGLDANLVIIDLELPGAAAVIGRIMRDRPVPILGLSTHDVPSAVTQRALAAGALEAISKRSLRLSEPDDAWAVAMRSRIKRLASTHLASRPRGGRRGELPPPRRTGEPVEIVAIGASTGGPQALASVLGALPHDFPVPVLVVQHITDGFESGFVSWLDQQLEIAVGFAGAGQRVGPGVWFAPQDTHLGIDARGRFVLDGETVCGPHRPSVDMLFKSLATASGGATLGVVLTGMGRDGAAGVEALRAAGGTIVAQDEESSVVFGMPRAAIEAGADRILPLTAIGPAVRAVRAAVPA